MHPLAQRILVNSLVAGSFLAVLGYGLTEFGRMWLATQTPIRPESGVRAAPAVPADEVFGYRVPLTMAAWGVAFVVVGDCFLWFVLKRRPVPKAPPAPPAPDPAEVLLEQLLREAEAKQAAAVTPPPAADTSRTATPAG